MARADCSMLFELLTTDGLARRGRLTFPRGVVDTPALCRSHLRHVKGLTPEQVASTGAQIVLGNTFTQCYALTRSDARARRPARVYELDKPILTDSGGFQVFSLGAMRKITEEGRSSNPSTVTFSTRNQHGNAKRALQRHRHDF